MTNKEWLTTLSSHALAIFCLEYMPLIGKDSLSSIHAIQNWLEQPYKEEYYVTKMFNDMLKLYNIQ